MIRIWSKKTIPFQLWKPRFLHSSTVLFKKEKEPNALKQEDSLLSPLFKAALQDGEKAAPKNTEELRNSVITKGHTGHAVSARPSTLVFTTGNMRVSQKKLNHLARLIKGMSIEQATAQMRMTVKKRGKDVAAMLKRSACALVHNWGYDASSVSKSVIVSQAWVGKGVFLKRIRIHGRGRTGKMTRPYAHLKVILKEKRVETELFNGKDAIDPLTGLPFTEARIKAKQDEWVKLVKMFKRDRLFVTMKDEKPIYPGNNTPWTRKGWKYVTSPKWLDPINALLPSKRPPRPIQ